MIAELGAGEMRALLFIAGSHVPHQHGSLVGRRVWMLRGNLASEPLSSPARKLRCTGQPANR